MTIAPPRPAAVSPGRLDTESFRAWYEDFSSRMERIQADGNRIRAALQATRKALRQTLEDFPPPRTASGTGLHHRSTPTA